MFLEENCHQRTIAHFDLDAFYVACERELNPNLNSKAVAVSQYNPHGKLEQTHCNEIDRRLVAKPATEGTCKVLNGDSNGSMIAVSYEARSLGVKRQDRGIDAIKKCPELYIVQVPVKRGKADLTMYRSASNRVMDVLVSSIWNDIEIPNSTTKRAEIKVEKASIDEIYIDLSIPVDKMTKILLSLQKEGFREMAIGQLEKGHTLWKDVLFYAKDCTTIGGVEELSSAARVANQLSKDEVRKGSKFQVLEKSLDIGSKKWWERPLSQWTSIELHLACGSALAAKARDSVKTRFRRNGCDVFTLSAGISSNKTLAKLASGLKKPNRQTVINATDERALQKLFHPMPVSRIKGLGGKFGESVMENLSVATVGDLAKVPLTILEAKYSPSAEEERPVAEFLYNIARGRCNEDVSERTVEKSMSSGKTFRGALALSISDERSVRTWLSELVGGLLERLNLDFEENRRMPSLMSLAIKLDGSRSHASKSSKAPKDLSHEAYVALATKLFRQFPLKTGSKIQGLTITAANFHEVASGEASIEGFFQAGAQPSLLMCQLSSPKRSLASSIRIQGKEKSLLGMWGDASTKGSERPQKRSFTKTHDIPTAIKEEKNGTNTVQNECDISNITNSDGIDASVLSQLPASIQSEIRIANMSRIGGNCKKQKIATSPMKKWLCPKSSEIRLGKMKNKSSLSSKKSSENKASPLIYQSEEIDPNVLAELPFHIQAMIRKEMKATKFKR